MGIDELLASYQLPKGDVVSWKIGGGVGSL